LDHGHACAERVRHPASALLEHVGQLVTEQLLALGRLGIVLARREVQVSAVGEGQSADRGRFVTDVDADVGEAGVEEPLHLHTYGLGRRLAPAALIDQVARYRFSR
jgi:hypothetical protein